MLARIGSMNRLFGGSQRLVSPGRPGRPGYLPPAGHAGSSISVQIRVSDPNAFPGDGRAGALSPSPPVFPASRRHGRAADDTAQTRSSWGLSSLVKQPPLRRRPARRPPAGFGLGRFPIQVSEDLLDDIGVLDAGDDPHRTAAGRTGLTGYLPVSDRSAAAFGCANRLACRFVDVDPDRIAPGDFVRALPKR